MIQVSGDIENWSGVKCGCRLTPGFAQPAGGGVRGTGWCPGSGADSWRGNGNPNTSWSAQKSGYFTTL